MKIDKYGNHVASSSDIAAYYLRNPESTVKSILVEHPIPIDPHLELQNLPQFVVWTESQLSVEEYDNQCQRRWHMPVEYAQLDIAAWVLGKCEGEAELQRAAQELLLYAERDLFDLLRYMLYLVDLMRSKNILWGVGRGSSISSFVLYKIGIHRINSLVYDLDINEFLK